MAEVKHFWSLRGNRWSLKPDQDSLGFLLHLLAVFLSGFLVCACSSCSVFDFRGDTHREELEQVGDEVHGSEREADEGG